MSNKKCQINNVKKKLSNHALSHGTEQRTRRVGEFTSKTSRIRIIFIEDNRGVHSSKRQHHKQRIIVIMSVQNIQSLQSNIGARIKRLAVGGSLSGGGSVTLPILSAESRGEVARNTTSMEDGIVHFKVNGASEAMGVIKLLEQFLTSLGGVGLTMGQLDIQLTAELALSGGITSITSSGNAIYIGIGDSLRVGGGVNVVVGSIKGVKTTRGGEVGRVIHTQMPFSDQMIGVTLLLHEFRKDFLAQRKTKGTLGHHYNVLEAIANWISSCGELCKTQTNNRIVIKQIQPKISNSINLNKTQENKNISKQHKKAKEKKTSQKGSTGGAAPRGNILVLEDHTISSKVIKTRGRHPTVPLETNIVPSQIISNNKNYVWLGFFGIKNSNQTNKQ